MKKLPTLLLTLVLVGVVAPALNGGSVQALGLSRALGTSGVKSPVGISPLAVQVADLADGAGGLVANTTDGQVKITYIWPENGRIEVEAESNRAELFPRRLLMVYYDYESGITEAEADVKARTLGERDYADWAILVQDYQDDSLEHKGKFSNQPDIKLDEVNKTDIVYFALEFGERKVLDNGEVVWSNTSWVREKLDYRNCVHASNFQKGDRCEAVSTGANTIDYWSGAKQPTDEHITTWAEEWWVIQQQRLAQIDNKSLDVVMGFYYSGSEQERDAWLDKGKDLLKQLQKMKRHLAKMADPRTLTAWRDSVEQRLLDLGLTLDEDESNNNGNDNSGEDGDGDSGNGGSGNGDDDNNTGGGVGGNWGDGGGNEDGGGNGGNGEGSSGGEGLTSQEQENRRPLTVVAVNPNRDAVSRQYMAKNDVLAVSVNEAGTTGGVADRMNDMQDEIPADGAGESSDRTTGEGTEVEVPATGETKRRIWDFWWVLIPVVGVLIMLVLWLKRAFGRNEE